MIEGETKNDFDVRSMLYEEEQCPIRGPKVRLTLSPSVFCGAPWESLRGLLAMFSYQRESDVPVSTM
jgi:hypothetical protein